MRSGLDEAAGRALEGAVRQAVEGASSEPPLAKTGDPALEALNDFKRQMLEKYGQGWREKATPEELAENTRLAHEMANTPPELPSGPGAAKANQPTLPGTDFTPSPNVVGIA